MATSTSHAETGAACSTPDPRSHQQDCCASYPLLRCYDTLLLKPLSYCLVLFLPKLRLFTKIFKFLPFHRRQSAPSRQVFKFKDLTPRLLIPTVCREFS